MRKLVSLVCVFALVGFCSTQAGIIPLWESPSRKFGFYPITNELSLYRSIDDSGHDRGNTMQFISINSFRLYTEFIFEFTADFNHHYSLDLTHDHYIEIGLVKHLTPFFSLNVQRVISKFEPKAINQYGFRLSF